jgi:hypothetical protein
MRPTSPRPRTFPAGALVSFTGGDGRTYSGTFVQRTYRRREGYYYEITVDRRPAVIFANGPVGRSVEPVR